MPPYTPCPQRQGLERERLSLNIRPEQNRSDDDEDDVGDVVSIALDGARTATFDASVLLGLEGT